MIHDLLIRVASALVQIAIALAAALSPVHAAGEKGNAPEVKVGDHWKLEQRDARTGIKESEFVRRITAVSPDLIEGTENDATLKMRPDLNPIESSINIAGGDPKFLNFPLEVGKKWSFKYTFANKTNSGKGRVQLDAEVVAYEKITVPAGTFDAFRIENRGFWNNDASRNNGRTKMVYWYAPVAKSVVRTEYEDGYNNWIRELVEFQLQP